MDRERNYLSELEGEDERIAGEMANLDGLAQEAEALRSRALELTGFLDRLPGERERIREEINRSDQEAVDARAAHERTRAELSAAQDGNDERLASARRFERRARDMVLVAERKRDAARGEQKALERRAAEVESDVPGVTEQAASLAEELSHRPRVSAQLAVSSPGRLADVAPWAGQARAAVLVARAGLATERDSIVRQANEIGSVILGESLGASSASAVARRVEASADR